MFLLVTFLLIPACSSYAGFGYGERCNSTTLCTYNTVCNINRTMGFCDCPLGYFWNSSTCLKGGHLRQPCVTTGQCLAFMNNSICDPNVKRCLCETGYGIANQSDGTCRKFPFHKVESAKFETGSRLHCDLLTTNLTEILWFLNGKFDCKHGNPECSEDENTTYADKLYVYSRGLQLKSVIQNHTYSCIAMNIEDGRTWIVSETQVFVVPKDEYTTVRQNGSDDTIYCNVATPNLEVRLLRDGNTFCTRNATWCVKRPGIGGSYTFFDIKNLRDNHTFACEVYSNDEKLATASIHHFIIVPKTEIFELTISPPGPLPIGTELVAIARFQSSFGEPLRRWKIDGVPITNQDELIILSEKEYMSRVNLGPIHHSSMITLEVISNYGSDTKKFKVNLDLSETRTEASWNSTYTSQVVTVHSSTTAAPSSATAGTFPTSQPLGRPIYYIKDSIFNIFLYPIKRQK